MQALKGLVIGMGLLIVTLMGILGWGIYQKANNPDFSFFKTGEPEIAALQPRAPLETGRRAAATAFGDVDVVVAAGAKIVSITPQGDALYLHLSGAAESVVVIDTRQGRVLGTVHLRPATP